MTGFPTAFPTGTRPIAIAPTAVPSANGVSTDDNANKYSANRDSSSAPRSAYAAPRKMIPIAAISKGAANVEVIDPYATG